VKVLGDNGTGTVVDTIQGILFARNYAINNPKTISSTTANGAGTQSINVNIPSGFVGITVHL